jgi:hypothetical protein
MKNVFLSEDEVFFEQLCTGASFVNHTDQLFSRLSARFAVHAMLGLNVHY